MTSPDDDPPVDDSPVDDSPSGDTPVDDSPVDDSPSGGTPVDDSPVDDPSHVDTPTDDTATASTSVDNTADGPVSSTAAADGEPSASRASSSPVEKLRTVGIATGLGIGAIVVSFSILLPLLVLGQWFGLPIPQDPLALISLELFVGQVIGMGGISALYLWKTGRGIEYVPIRRPTLVETAIIIAAPFGIIFVTATISQLSLLLGVEPSEHSLGALGDIDPMLYLYMVPLVIFIVGPFEELLYRGVVQTRLRESFGVAAAILLASVIFALIHIPAHGFGGAGIASTAASMMALVGGSIVFGAIYEYTQNLTVVAVIHGLYDAILLTLLYVITVYGPEIEQMAEQADQVAVVVGF